MEQFLIIIWMGIMRGMFHMLKHSKTCNLKVFVDTKWRVNLPCQDEGSDMVKFLKTNPQITHLLLERKYSDSSVLPCVLDMVIEVIMANIPTLTHLNLQKLNLTTGELSLIAEALKKNSSLLYVNLMSNNIDDKGAAIIAGVLRHNTGIGSMLLGNNMIRESGIKAIGESLESNTNLRSLGLCFNYSGIKGFLQLAKSLYVNKGLQFLNIRNNAFGMNNYEQILESFRMSPSLKSLSFYCSDFDNKFGPSLDSNMIYFILLCNQRRGMLGNGRLINDIVVSLFPYLNITR